MFLRQNSSFQSVKNPLKILILTIFFEGWLCIISPYATGLFAKSSTQKRLWLYVCFHSSQLVRTLEFYSLFLSSQSILSHILAHRWLRYGQHRWMISSARAQPRVCVSSVWTLVNRASVETTVFICFVTQKPWHCARVTTPFNSVEWP